jgi:hypothetical protein
LTDQMALSVRVATLKDIFRPASPTVDPDLFKGRATELSQVIGAIQEVGMHAVIYGERGVGKTSLGFMAREAFREVYPLSLALRVTCNMDDDFESIWAKIPASLRRQLDDASEQSRTELQPLVDRVDDILELNTITPDTVARALYLLGSHVPTLVIIDEFDRIGDWESTKLFPDLIKAMSDDPSTATVLLIGVADDVDGLVQGHASIDRALRQVYMPRMTRTELAQIVNDGVDRFKDRAQIDLEIEPAVTASIVLLSQGFPYYTHLLAGAIVEKALREETGVVTQAMVFGALFASLETAAQSIRLTYAEAVNSQQNATFAETLLACALAKIDVLGFFAASDVIPPLSQISGNSKSQSDFNHHLKRFAGPPSRILESKGTTRVRYRFADPLMKPFVLMTGIRDGMVAMPGEGEDQEEPI